MHYFHEWHSKIEGKSTCQVTTYVFISMTAKLALKNNISDRNAELSHILGGELMA